MQRINKEAYVSDSVFVDRFTKIPYTKLTQEEEIKYMKRLKLSYYYEVDQKTKEQYIKYYSEVFPDWYRNFKYTIGNNKEEVLKKGIENSLKYREYFIKNNIRLVVHIAKKFQRYDSIENLCQEGMVGLINAVKHFKFDNGNKFSSFATVAIRRSIIRYIQDNSNNIRIPNKKFSDMNILSDVELKLTQETGEIPSDEEIMAIMDIDENRLKELRRCREISKTTSLDEPIDDANNSVLGDFIEDKTSSFEERINNSLMSESLIKLIENLEIPYYNKNIVYMRYGINGFDEPQTYQEIASFYNISKTRVQQIERKVLKMLKHQLIIQKEQELLLENNNKEQEKEKLKEFRKIDKLKERLNDQEFRYIRESLLCTNLKKLSQTQKFVLTKVYGLDGKCLMDSEIAGTLGLTVEQIHIIEKSTLNKLYIKLPNNIKKYKNF